MARKPKFNIAEDEFDVNPNRIIRQLNTSSNSSVTPVDIEIDKLIPDEENEELCGRISQESIESLADDIKNDGFKGTIMAYPIEGNVYRIESGHKRVMAAKKAGLTKLPVIITDPPKSDAERQYRLISMNLHGREKLLPSEQARRTTHLMYALVTLRTEQGLPADIATIQPMVAKQLEYSEKSIQKYRQFAGLVRSLQDLADQGVSWSALVQCSSFPEERQEEIATSIKNEIEHVGIENISRPWILTLIKNTKRQMIDGNIVETPKVPKRPKRRDGAKLIAKCAKDFEDIVANNVFIKENNKKEAVENLKAIRNAIDKKLEELNDEEE